jgi:broad specificity phosphatase PhoE
VSVLQQDCTEIHLFRHGETVWNRVGKMQGHLNSPLSPVGVKQAVDARKKIEGLPFDYAYSSSSGRALETISLLLDDCEFPVVPLDDLREINLGVWEGVAVEEVKRRYPLQHHAFWSKPEEYIPVSGGESFDEVCSRAVSVMDELFHLHPGKRLLVVSHAAFLKTYLCHITGLGNKAIWQEPKAVNLAYSVIRKNGSEKPTVAKFCDRVWKQE